MPVARPGGEEPGLGALDDQLALELDECREDPEDQLAGGGRRVDGRPVASEDLQAHTALRELVDQVDEVAQVAPEPIELPGDQDVTLPQGFEAGREPGPVVALSGDQVLVEVLGLGPGSTRAA